MNAFKEELLKQRELTISKLITNPDYIALKHIDALLLQFDGGKDPETTSSKIVSKKETAFPSNATYLSQIAYVIKDANRFLHVNEIYDVLKEFWTDIDESKARTRISTKLSIAKREGVGNITSYQAGTSKKSYVWGSKNWLDADDKPLDEYKPTYVKENKRKSLDIL